MKEHIVEIKKLIPQHYCNKIISYFSDNKEDASTVGGTDKSIRNCKLTNLLEANSFGKKLIVNYIKEKIFASVEEYKKKFKFVDIEKISQLDLLEYEANEYKAGYKFHTDFGTSCQERLLSISICLNNDFYGGEFMFDLNGEMVCYPQNVGDCIIFPSNFMFPHQVNKITQGTRYALIGWVV